jgi:hypothetical protein
LSSYGRAVYPCICWLATAMTVPASTSWGKG